MSYTKCYRSHQNNSPCWNNIDYKWSHFAVPVNPHAGGVGLCEMVMHLSMFYYCCVTKSMENRYEFYEFILSLPLWHIVSWQPCKSQYFIIALSHCRFTEFADHLHEHFVDPVVVKNGCYQASSVSNYPSFIV